MAKKYLLKGNGYADCGIARVDAEAVVLELYDPEEIHDTYNVARVTLLITLDTELERIKDIIKTLEGLDEEAYFKPLEKMNEKI